MKRSLIIFWLGTCLTSNVAHGESLYREQSYRSLVSDVKALRPGDSLTVLIVENASATSAADTNAKRKTDVGLSFFDTDRNNQFGLNHNNDFDGRASTQRSGRLLAQISVNVTAVAENGEMWVKGEQLVEINDEKQQIRLEGRVRPQDISENNTVLSSRLSDAKIGYVGDGVLAERQKPGWLARALIWLGL